MTFSRIGRLVLGLVAAAALGLGITACGGGTIGYMWVLGMQPNAGTGIITGFKIDHYTGNLTAIPHSPFPSGGANPVSLVIKPGGRFVYVVNAGTPASGSGTTAVAAVPGNVAIFSVGGDGVLVFQQSYPTQGSTPVWATFDLTGNYLYVLDSVDPTKDGNGDVSAFSVDPTSGRLTVLLNTALSNSTQQIAYFEVGPTPSMIKTASNGCLYALSANQVFPLQSGSGGQLTTATTGPLFFAANHLTSINTSGTYVYLTDGPGNQIFPLSSGSTACSLSTAGTGVVSNFPANANPVNSIAITSASNNFLYVINQSTTATGTATSNSSISAYVVQSNGTLVELSDASGDNPYSTGSAPVCITVDPSNEYLYTSDSASRTVTGKTINLNTGLLSGLSRGSTFTLVGTPTCLAVSGNVQ